MAVIKYKDPATGEVKKVGAPVADAYSKTETDSKINAAKKEANNHANNKSNPHGVTCAQIGAAPAYSYGTTDLTAGVSALETGKLHFVYE